jgi:hypothetical protein
VKLTTSTYAEDKNAWTYTSTPPIRHGAVLYEAINAPSHYEPNFLHFTDLTKAGLLKYKILISFKTDQCLNITEFGFRLKPQNHINIRH